MRSHNSGPGTPITLGDLMRSQRRNAVKSAAMFMAVVLYGTVLLYTGVHNFNLMSRTMAADQQLFAVTALLCLEGAAIFLPLAIHFWLAPGPQRLVGYLLYASNFAIVVLNTVLDAMTNRAEAVPDWLRLYATFIVPAAPVLIGIGIAFIFILDPSKKIHDARAAAEAASMDAMALHMREAANRDEINQAIRLAALKDMQEATGRAVGVQPMALPEPRRSRRAKTAQQSPHAELTVMGMTEREMPRLASGRKPRARKSRTQAR
ncbi:MAG: hypothetical protein RMN25_10870 [Anaerolineae bacterium]|nr:hypothetical protein [Thermoflexales bacterium]MDW8408269.1 hypothetical protein [Anaerolineae bacterium]